MHAPVAADDVHVETLTMITYYHTRGGTHALDHGHTAPSAHPRATHHSALRAPIQSADTVLILRVKAGVEWVTHLYHATVAAPHAVIRLVTSGGTA